MYIDRIKKMSFFISCKIRSLNEIVPKIQSNSFTSNPHTYIYFLYIIFYYFKKNINKMVILDLSNNHII